MSESNAQWFQLKISTPWSIQILEIKKTKLKKKKKYVSEPWHQDVSLRLNQLPSSAIFKKKSKEKLKISLTKYENI
jgi:hypothetical protein